MIRRLWPLSRLLLVFAALRSAPAQTEVPAQVPITGEPSTTFAGLDPIVERTMQQYGATAASLAISVDGRLVYARGFGFQDASGKQAVQPQSRFRIASISKPITATAVLRLIEQGKLSLDTKPFATILTDLVRPFDQGVDKRLFDITIKDLLEHKGGWDDHLPGIPDPVFNYTEKAATAYGATPPATPELLIRYMAKQPLQHDPGTVNAYSNFGYVVLGAVISRVSAMSYADYVQQEVLTPAGLSRIVPGHTRLTERLADEVTYMDSPHAPLVASVIQPLGALVPVPYGGFSLELIRADGGWIASAIDLVRFADMLNGQLPSTMLKRPPPGFTGYIPPQGKGWIWHFSGSLPGTNTHLHLDTTGKLGAHVTWALLFNSRGDQPPGPVDSAEKPIVDYLRGITEWPAGDLFLRYADGPEITKP